MTITRENFNFPFGGFIALILSGILLANFAYVTWLVVGEEADHVVAYELLTKPPEAYEGGFFPLILIPIVGVAGVGLSLLSIFRPPLRRRLSRYIMIVGLVGLAYYAIFFLQNADRLSDLTAYVNWGFVFGLIMVIGLVLQVLIPRREVPAGTALTEPEDEAIWGLFMIGPMLILTLIFVIYPIFGSIQMTMYNWSGIGTPTQYVGLRHFETVAGDQRFWNAFKNTIMYTVVLVPIQLALALSLALILNNPRMRFRTFYKTVYFLPVVTSLSIVAIVVRLMLQSGGLYVSQALGINPPINPIGDAKYSMWAVIGFGTWYSFGINLVYFLAALQTVPEELYDAAKVDGANGLQRLLHVTLPSIRPVATIILFFAILGSLRVFEQSFVLTRGGPFFSSEVVAGYIYSYAFGGVGVTGQTANIGFASAAAFFMSLIVLGVTVIQIAVGRRVNRERV